MNAFKIGSHYIAPAALKFIILLSRQECWDDKHTLLGVSPVCDFKHCFIRICAVVLKVCTAVTYKICNLVIATVCIKCQHLVSIT